MRDAVTQEVVQPRLPQVAPDAPQATGPSGDQGLVLRLQRTAGNRAVTRLVQSGSGARDPRSPLQPMRHPTSTSRQGFTSSASAAPAIQRSRIPGQAALSDILPVGGENTDAHLEGLERLLRLVLTDPDPERGLTDDQRGEVIRRAQGGLSTAQFLGLPDQTRFQMIATAIEQVRPDRAVRDPGLMRSAARPATQDAANIATLVSNVTSLIDDILGAADIDTWLAQVFGAAHVATAKDRYGLARTALNDLAARDRILTDRSGYSAEVGLGGTTMFQHSIELEPQTVDDPGHLGSQILTLHEAMHAGNDTVDDFGYANTPGFTTMPTARKVDNAAHYEVAALRLRDPGDDLAFLGQTFTPASSGGPDPGLTIEEDARNQATDMFENAWAASLDLYDRWVEIHSGARSWSSQAPAMRYWSRVENLTVHRKTVIDGSGADTAAVSQIDLALSEGVSRGLSDAGSHLDGVADPLDFERSRATADERSLATGLASHRELLVRCALRALGRPLTGPEDRDVRVIQELVAAEGAGSYFQARDPGTFPFA